MQRSALKSMGRFGKSIFCLRINDIEFVKRLMSEQAVRALPGSFMGMETAYGNPGAGYVRLALVHDFLSTEKALKRVAKVYKSQC